MDDSAQRKARVVVCDDHEIVREAIKARVASSPAVEIVGEASNGRDVVEVASELKADLLIIDLELPRRDGIEAARELLKLRPRTKVIILTAHDRPDLVPLALQAGARGYVLKSGPAGEIERAIEVVCAGGTYVSREFSGPSRSAALRLLDLSARQRQILELSGEGVTDHEIAERLELSTATIHTHVRNAVVRLKVANRNQAVALAVRYSFLGGTGSSRNGSPP
jgi:DNA-binding NarL/FixJ family response regulator